MLCLVYNATGDMIKFHANKDWYGHIGETPYPTEILNGQWGAFLHVQTTSPLPLARSNAAVVYRGLNNAGSECDWLLSWSNPFNREGNKMMQVYTVVRKAGHFDTAWDEMSKGLERNHETTVDTSNGCVSSMTIRNSTSPIVEAILTLEHAEEAKPTTGHAQVSPTVGAITTSEHAEVC
ncbi:hypothetical protein C1H46_030179 [Malus baccata]|uniref:23 kDa jasmonate-induced protein-like n=1 Tax=Malus baccata TaxID=106549 RepID=A0A540LCP6_MALBA|nr:hypothetical protein C1H46_030179 [Malus baccata]